MTSAAVPRRRPPGRYDQPSRAAQRALAVVLGALFVGLVAAIMWTLYARYGTASVSAQVRGYQVLSDRAVRVEFEVTAPAGQTVYCLVRARDRAFADVGRLVVPVPVPGGGRARVQQELTTSARAVTGEVPLCRSQQPTDEPLAPPASPLAP